MQFAQIFLFTNASSDTRMILGAFGWSMTMSSSNVDIYPVDDHASMKNYFNNFSKKKFTLLLQIVKVCAVLRHRQVVMVAIKIRMEHRVVLIDHQLVQHHHRIIVIRMMQVECKMIHKWLVLYSKIIVVLHTLSI